MGNTHGLWVGKLPAPLLERLLGMAQGTDPRVLVGPGVGADAAVVEMGGRLLVAKSDPITFATDRIGWYVVQVNANDIACMGARPRWLVCTLLLPEGCTPALAEDIFRQVVEACRALDITLIGGHTEVTYGLTRPLAIGAMLGEVERERLVRPGGAHPGDLILLTKGIALEGTALLAREAEEALLRRGLTRDQVAQAQRLLVEPGISIVREALAAAATGQIHALHDPTEGGLATALWELAHPAGVGLEVDAEAIPVLEECRAVCGALGLDPLGMLASGALLIVVPPEAEKGVRQAVEKEGIPCAVIGRVLGKGEGLFLVRGGHREPLPTFPRDEVARWFSQPAEG
ncbi:MAG: AIR synthase family protein [Dehalococcoidia bacterium]|nr:AIR synthase family protein [Dehalococcoidia bacterium]MDW8120412.1 AIR synthase family protein [Chloroflexota bacterium]